MLETNSPWYALLANMSLLQSFHPVHCKNAGKLTSARDQVAARRPLGLTERLLQVYCLCIQRYV